MKKRYIPLILITIASMGMSDAVAETHSEPEIVQIHPRFDSGRVRTNTQIDGHSFNQWNNGASNAGNVGLNEQGIWYSFIRLGAERAEDSVVYNMDVAELFGKLSSAGSIILQSDIYWLERNPDFPVDPGLDISVWLVPGMNIPEGSFPTFSNTWPWNHADAVKVASIPVSEMQPLRASWSEEQLSPVTELSQMEFNLQIDMTAAIKDAIASGAMTDSTMWGVVFFPEAMEDQLDVPNNPAWATLEGTVIHNGFHQLVMSGEADEDPVLPTTWFGFEIEADGWVSTGDWMGDVYVANAPWIYVLALGRYTYIPNEDYEWVYILR